MRGWSVCYVGFLDFWIYLNMGVLRRTTVFFKCGENLIHFSSEAVFMLLTQMTGLQQRSGHG